jgi:putative ABC transport system permease protein
MTRLRVFLSRVRSLFFKRRLDEALDEELRTHLAMLADDYVRAGVSPGEARRQARLRLGGIEQTKEAVRDARATWIDSVWQDVRYAFRTFARTPGFTIVAVLTLALGIGANTAIFSVVSAVLFRPLPYPDSSRLMAILSTSRSTGKAFGSAQGVFVDWRERAKSFDLMAGARRDVIVWSGIEQPRRLPVGRVSDSFFALVGARPAIGRTFTRDEDRYGQGKVAVLDGAFWQREFGGKLGAVGRTVVLDDTPYTIVGVLPTSVRFAYFGATDV